MDSDIETRPRAGDKLRKRSVSTLPPGRDRSRSVARRAARKADAKADTKNTFQKRPLVPSKQSAGQQLVKPTNQQVAGARKPCSIGTGSKKGGKTEPSVFRSKPLSFDYDDADADNDEGNGDNNATDITGMTATSKSPPGEPSMTMDMVGVGGKGCIKAGQDLNFTRSSADNVYYDSDFTDNTHPLADSGFQTAEDVSFSECMLPNLTKSGKAGLSATPPRPPQTTQRLARPPSDGIRSKAAYMKAPGALGPQQQNRDGVPPVWRPAGGLSLPDIHQKQNALSTSQLCADEMNDLFTGTGLVLRGLSAYRAKPKVKK
jgi:hypothetical protein